VLSCAQVQGFVSEHTKHIEAIYQALVALSKEHNANPSAKLTDATSIALCNVVKRYVSFHSKYISYRIMRYLGCYCYDNITRRA